MIDTRRVCEGDGWLYILIYTLDLGLVFGFSVPGGVCIFTVVGVVGVVGGVYYYTVHERTLQYIYLMVLRRVIAVSSSTSCNQPIIRRSTYIHVCSFGVCMKPKNISPRPQAHDNGVSIHLWEALASMSAIVMPAIFPLRFSKKSPIRSLKPIRFIASPLPFKATQPAFSSN